MCVAQTCKRRRRQAKQDSKFRKRSAAALDRKEALRRERAKGYESRKAVAARKT